MEIIILLSAFILLCVLLAVGMFLFHDIAINFIRRLKHKVSAPFIPTPHRALPAILDALQLRDGATLYDLGCGNGTVLAFLKKKYPRATYVGFEHNLVPLLCAKILHRGMRIVRKDFFRENLSPATHLFAFLLPEVLDALLPKLERELKPGTRMVTLDFKFSNRAPHQVIYTKTPSPFNIYNSKLGRTIYVYVF